MIAMFVGALGAAACGSDGPSTPGVPFSVMTRNLYLGADLTPLAAVPSPDLVPSVTATIWGKVQASDFPARAKVLANEIVSLAPDVVALQEVSLYRRQAPSDYQPGDAVPNATEVVLDFLATLMTEIDARGGGYRVAGTAQNADAELPVADGMGGLFDLRVTDRDVILARERVQTADFTAMPFDARFMLQVGGTGGVPVTFVRSSSRIHAAVEGTPFELGNGHLEIEFLSDIQMAQAQQMIDDLAAVEGPMVLLGDFNSSPGKDSYPRLVPPFRDAYPQVNGTAPGLTCCQADDLRNAVSMAQTRIDLVLYRGAIRVNSVSVVGSDPSTDRTPSGLWPTDHFGVFAKLEAVP